MRAVQAEGQINGHQRAYPNGSPARRAPSPHRRPPSFQAAAHTATGWRSQLAMVARLIRGRGTLGAKRQVFFVSMGGFDLHDNLIANQPGLMAAA